MKRYYKTDEWSVIEEGFNPHLQEASESIFSLGNGHMGQRANFEEKYSGESLQGNYIAGIYYPDKTADNHNYPPREVVPYFLVCPKDISRFLLPHS